MDPRTVPLLYLSAAAGLVMVVGGIWLIYKEKIYIDRETKQVTEVETPFGKFKTNVPALVLFVLGFVPLIYPIAKSVQFFKQVQIEGAVKADKFPVTVYAIIKLDTLQKDGHFVLPVPQLQDVPDYRILYLVNGTISDETTVDVRKVKDGKFELQPSTFSGGGGKSLVPDPIPPVPEEFAQTGG